MLKYFIAFSKDYSLTAYAEKEEIINSKSNFVTVYYSDKKENPVLINLNNVLYLQELKP